MTSSRCSRLRTCWLPSLSSSECRRGFGSGREWRECLLFGEELGRCFVWGTFACPSFSASKESQKAGVVTLNAMLLGNSA